jgi:hypothetical protein
VPARPREPWTKGRATDVPSERDSWGARQNVRATTTTRHKLRSLALRDRPPPWGLCICAAYQRHALGREARGPSTAPWHVCLATRSRRRSPLAFGSDFPVEPSDPRLYLLPPSPGPTSRVSRPAAGSPTSGSRSRRRCARSSSERRTLPSRRAGVASSSPGWPQTSPSSTAPSTRPSTS